MGKITKTENIRLEIEPYVDTFSWSKQQPTEKEQIENLKQLQAQIRRHCDEAGYIRILYDTNSYCEFCGYKWNPDENGFNCCCDEEVKREDFLRNEQMKAHDEQTCY